jgi:hypothetical protein
MLLRLNFLGSSVRAQFMRSHTPDVYVLPNRPSFTGNGTDSIEYTWFVWRHGNAGRAEGKLTLLSETPLAERQAWSKMLRAKTKAFSPPSVAMHHPGNILEMGRGLETPSP